MTLVISVARHATATDCDRRLSCWSADDEAVIDFCAIHTDGRYNQFHKLDELCYEADGWSAHPVMIKTAAKQALLENIHDELFDG